VGRAAGDAGLSEDWAAATPDPMMVTNTAIVANPAIRSISIALMLKNDRASNTTPECLTIAGVQQFLTIRSFAPKVS